MIEYYLFLLRPQICDPPSSLSMSHETQQINCAHFSFGNTTVSTFKHDRAKCQFVCVNERELN